MSCYLYKVENNNYTQVDELSLSGWNGLVFKIFDNKELYSKLSEDVDGIGWEITKEEFNEQIIKDDWGIGNHEIIFDTETITCTAFPKEIPDKIFLGDNDHSKPLKGQGNKIVFETKEK